MARTLGYWFDMRQSASQMVCLAVIDAFLVSLIVFDRRRQSSARPYIMVLGAYIAIEAIWIMLGRPV